MSSRIVPGRRFGRLLVVEIGHADAKTVYWKCVCDCGVQTVKRACNLLSGSTSSCGCFKKIAKVTHGYSTNGKIRSGYYSYRKMLDRCLKPSDISFKNYGARGITVCQEWQGDGGFTRFINHIGDKPEPCQAYSLDRIDNSKGYEPHNVRWATRSQQNRNRRPRSAKMSNGKPGEAESQLVTIDNSKKQPVPVEDVGGKK